MRQYGSPSHPRFTRTPLALAVTGGMAFAGLAHADVQVTNEEVASGVESEEATLTVTQVVGGIEHPWAVAWLPDERMLITARPGNLYLVDGDEVTEVGNLPKIDTDEDQKPAPEGGNQGGLLDVVVHPDYDDNGWIYFTYSSPGDDDSVMGDDEYGTGTALARARLSDDGSELTDLETIYAQVPRTAPGRHYGSRIVFPGDGSVMFSIGDRGIRYPSQDLTDPGGSIIRLHEDGGAFEGNPFIEAEPGNLRPEIFSYGHRNNQGLALHPETGELWAIDHGPSGGGEQLYVAEAGSNHGWPQVSFGREYDTDEFIGIGEVAPGVKPPVHVWEDTLAPSGLTFYTGDEFPGWQGNLFIGALYAERLHRVVLDGETIAHEEILLENELGRIRDVRQGPDGMLYVLTDESDGGLYRIEPEA
ncbi:PQQ-dependent sugar dehydrogenase [Billgrantia aerodenitrificans]|uniref:PQQ-dependent sugar dehydrogenase n=1 Tax=Billgrantia aerodenitrificans TaxID=2733483 RepID=A0ABS9AZK2_9GAMM|nr:PQQ-dependent sugar dehydrogenase [Halomonas aerodenitrificans]MCE8027052.1 PQQ-dependent sugar dehydrogenase [Halomonas aerodenitrificans]